MNALRTALVSCVGVAAVSIVAPMRGSAQVTAWSSQSAFGAAFAPLTVETFTSDYHFTLGSTLNSSTSFTPTSGTPVNPGDIQPGVTYSVSGGPLLIDALGGFVGGFLDGIGSTYGTVGPLDVTFDGTVGEFGFNTDAYMGSFSVLVYYDGGLSELFDYAAPADGNLYFYGFSRPGSDITGAVIGNTDGGYFNFMVDDFSFGSVTNESATPEPATVTLMATGLVGLVGTGFRRKKRRA